MFIKGTIIYDGEKNEYRVINKINSGGFSSIYKIEKVETNEIYILKTFTTEFYDQKELNSFINEFNNAKFICHPNVIKYIFLNDGNIYKKLPEYIIMEYANEGNLEQYIQNMINEKVYLSNYELKDIYIQLINGMKAINEKVIHRDIKTQNILIHNKTIKISDFGIGKISNKNTRDYTFKGCGSLEYIAPEAWEMEKNTIQMDIYSMGIVFYKLATLKYPYKLIDKGDIRDIYRNAHLFQTIEDPLKINKDLSHTYISLISRMLEKSPNKRFEDWNQILNIINSQDNEIEKEDNIINRMLAVRHNRDDLIRKDEIEEIKKSEKIKEDDKFVEYSFLNSIYNPIKKYLEKFNKEYSYDKVEIKRTGKFKFNIITISKNNITIEIENIINREFKEPYKNIFYGDKVFYKPCRLTIKDREILAWGMLKNNKGRGVNLILLKEDDRYGNWIQVKNTNSGLSRENRIEPFAFEFNELEKEVNLFDVTHIYNSEISDLNIEELFQNYIIDEI